MFSPSVGRWLRATGAVVLVAALMPLTGTGAASASQQGQDHQVTICHRTNSENNPYVVITIDKAAIFKRGHDTHDEGGVYQPGDKANGVRWGDIIPPFDYYATPKSDEQDHYDGLNYEEGQAILEGGCEVPGEGEQPEPTGSFDLPCVDTGDDVVISSDDIDSDGAQDVTYRLLVKTGGSTSTVAVTEAELEATGGYTVSGADIGSEITLQARIGDGEWMTLDGPKTVQQCETETPAAAGSFTTECTDTAAQADIGTVTNADGGTLALVATGFSQAVTSGQQDVPVPASTTLKLEYTKGGSTTVLDTETSPAACPTSTPTGALQASKTVSPTGAVDFGDTLTYSITVSATGTDQTGVVVTDYLPGYKPGETSGTTTLVTGSATCVGVGTCDVSYDAASHLLTWGIGTVAAGSNRTVTFQVTVDTPAADENGAIPATTIRNSGAARSAETPETPTNVVVNDVVAVQGTKTVRPGSSGSGGSGGSDTGVEGTKTGPSQLAHTGSAASTWWTLLLGLGMLLAGAALVTGGRLPRPGRRSAG